MANKKTETTPGEEFSPSEEKNIHSEERRKLEERIQDAKDSALRLWERTRSLQEKQGILENRAKWLPWFAVALLVGSVGLSAVITKYQLTQVRQQLADLQAASSQQAVAQSNLEEMKRDLLESVKQMAPTLLAAAVKEGRLLPPSKSLEADAKQAPAGTTPLSLATPAEGPGGEALRIVVGQTDPKKTRWVQYSEGGIAVDIDTASGAFSSPPYYFTSLGGHTNNWMAQGVTSIYEPTAKGFRVHVGYRNLTAAQAQQWGWYVNWIAIGK